MKALKKVFSNIKTIYLVLNGFKYQIATEYNSMIMQKRDYKGLKGVMQILPLDTRIDKLFEDILTAKLILDEGKNVFPKQYAVTSNVNGRRVFVSLQKTGEISNFSIDEIIDILKNTGNLQFRKSRHMLLGTVNELKFVDQKYFINDVELSEEQVRSVLNNIGEDYLLLQGVSTPLDVAQKYNCEAPVIHFIYLKKEDGEHQLTDAYVAEHKREDGKINVFSNSIAPNQVDFSDHRILKAIEFGKSIVSRFGEMEVFHMAIQLTEDGFYIFEVDAGKIFACNVDFSLQVKDYIDKKKKNKISISLKEKANILNKYFFEWRAKRKGFIGYMYRNWLNGLKDDKLTDCTTRAEKKWAHKRGFYSYRIKQYGLTEANYKEFLSDYQYKWLRPINNNYQKWLWDKIEFFYIMNPFEEYLPKYWCRIVPGSIGGEAPKIYSFDKSLKDGDIDSIQDIIILLKQKEKLVLKLAVGSHGLGYHKLEYDRKNDSFLINGKSCNEEQIADLINNVEKTSFISEYVEMHHDLKKIYDKVSYTMRIMTINEPGHPFMRNAYLRIAAKFSGTTDNVASGGIVAKVDLNSGRFYGAESLVNHEFTPCKVHPDTGQPLEGNIPNWELICHKINEMCQYLAPLEYLGFDVVVTEDGFKVLEINTHQDLHKYKDYSADIKNYFKIKIQYKKALEEDR